MVRFLTSLIIGAVVTFLLFLIMALLVKGSGERQAVDQERIIVEINTTPPDSDTQVRRPPPPPPPPPPAQPPKTPQPEPEMTNTAGAIGFNMPGLDLGVNTGLGDPGSLLRDGDATPIVRIEPRYPVQAARDGLTGYVTLRFTIMEDGSVGEVEVIEAEPRRVFDREAIRALNRWKYSPKVVDGKPQRQPGIVVRLDFTLDMAGG
ncbi:energy transducer TonB [Arsukibacterium sp.]|uniref:energy transducer TonB n=1 Tax=Arsukibacterium sp. TaxID=1977258 RepID=UPI002FDB2827